MTTLTFLGSHVSYQPTYIRTVVDNSKTMKYRGQAYEIRQPIAASAGMKGLTYRGVAY
jgi:Domain of unknown function (DUF4278)